MCWISDVGLQLEFITFSELMSFELASDYTVIIIGSIEYSNDSSSNLMK